MSVEQYLEILGCDVYKPNNLQVNHNVNHNGIRYTFVNRSELEPRWLVYHPHEGQEPTISELNEKEVLEFIYENFIDVIREKQLNQLGI